jgi:hypothetical protein
VQHLEGDGGHHSALQVFYLDHAARIFAFDEPHGPPSRSPFVRGLRRAIQGNFRLELKADIVHRRKWRRSVEDVQRASMRVAITVIITCSVGVLWLCLSFLLGK